MLRRASPSGGGSRAAADVELGVGRVGRRARRARGTRGSAPGRCGAPSPAGGWRCGPGRRLPLPRLRSRPRRLRWHCGRVRGRRLGAVVPATAGDDDDRDDHDAAIERRAATSRRRRIWRAARASRRRGSALAATPAHRPVCLGRSAIRGGDHGREGTDAERRSADREPRRGAARAPTRSWRRSRRRRRIPSTWSAAPSATCCSAAAAPTSTSSSRATPRRWPRGSGAERARARALRHRQGRARRPRGRHRQPPAPRPTRTPARCPRSTPAPTIEADLGRRDFTLNAMAIPLGGEPRLIDPHGGRADLEAGLLRVLHARSFVDDPTRALRAARYAARLGFELEPETEALLRATDLGTVSADRREAELLRLAARSDARRAASSCSPSGGWSSCARAASSWPRGSPSCSPRRPGADERRPRARRCSPPRSARPGAEGELAAARARAPLARRSRWPRGRDPVELVLARALGAEWLDDYLGEWRAVALEIDGADLIAAGVPEGPALGRGLRGGAAAQARRRDRRPRAGAGRGARGGREAELSRRSAICFVSGMEWRESDGVRWLEAELRRGPGRLLDPRSAGSARRPSTRLNLGVLTDDDRRRRGREPAAARGGARARRRSGSRSAARSTAPSSRFHAGPAGAEPVRRARQRDARGRRPRRRRARPGAARLRRRLPAGRPRRARRGGDAALRLARPRGRDRRRAAPRRSAPPTPRSAPGSAPAATRSATRCSSAFADLGDGDRRRAACSTWPRSPAGCSREAGVERVEAAGLCTSCEPELFFSHRRDARPHRPPGRARLDRAGGGLRWPELIHGIDPAKVAANLERVARGRRRGGRDPRRLPSTCRWRRWGRWPRPG